MGDFRVRDYLTTPAQIVRARSRFRAAETWGPAQRRRATQERLAAVLHHAVTNVPYYRETLAPYRRRFDQMVADLDLSPLPYLTKADIRGLGSALWADDHRRYRPSIGRTSGTTGTPMAFLLDRESHIAHFAGIWNMLNWMGYGFGRRFADMHATPLPGNKAFHLDRRLNCLRLCTSHLAPDTVGEFNAKMAKTRPYFLKGTPSTLHIYARLLEDSGVSPYQPTTLLTCAETLYSHYRQTLERVFDGPVFDFYNQNERACLFSTCRHGRYHVHEDYSHVELVDAAPGFAEVVTTTLHNKAMPLIRYRTNDVTELDDDGPCACGRTSRVVKRVVGRANDVVVLPNGHFCAAFAFLFEDQPGVRLAQIYQEDVSAIEVRIVATADFDRIKTPPVLEAEMRKWMGDEIAIHFDFPTAIPPGENGKIQFIKSLPGQEMVGGVRSMGQEELPAARALAARERQPMG